MANLQVYILLCVVTVNAIIFFYYYSWRTLSFDIISDAIDLSQNRVVGPQISGRDDDERANLDDLLGNTESTKALPRSSAFDKSSEDIFDSYGGGSEQKRGAKITNEVLSVIDFELPPTPSPIAKVDKLAATTISKTADANPIFDFFEDEPSSSSKKSAQRYEAQYVKIRDLPLQVATDEEYNLCMESLRPIILESSRKTGNTVHEKFARDVVKISVEVTCKSSRKWWLVGSPHFTGGRQQYIRYMSARGWVLPEGVTPNMPPLTLPKSTVIAIASCAFVNLPILRMQRKGIIRLASMAPVERRVSLKWPFFLSAKKLFDLAGCDYRRFYPETHVVNSQRTCEQLVDHIKEENVPDRLWFLKFPIESFGRGIVLRTATESLENELSVCEQFGNSSTNKSRILFQHRVENIIKYEDRYTQGRAYFLISSYDPITAWFFMGYFNVAAILLNATLNGSLADWELDDSNNNEPLGTDEKSNNILASSEERERNLNQSATTGIDPLKAAHVTNLDLNQNSKRLFFHELLQEKTPKEIALAYHNIKRAALTAFLALKPSLGKTTGSFSLIGFDFLLETDYGVKVLETNCNCELFSNAFKFGKERVMSSTVLMDGMMDIVLASNLDPNEFGDLLKKHLETDESRFKDPREAFRADGSRYPGIGSWELIYSEAVEPTFQYTDVFEKNC